ncbi:MAG: Type fimbrial biosis protein PilY1 [Myxococcaceae bacterium]|nr:Type fimbrial biosis protein PilY1 [Myxococcaceae bacterium]
MQLNRKRLGAVAFLISGWLAAPVATQAQPVPGDVRLIRPNIMVLLDTSGSMEFRTNTTNNTCIGANGGDCNRCSNGVSICSPSCPPAEQRNRWTTAVEVLTGTINGFTCVESDRTTSDFNYDYLYPYSHHQPLSNGVPLHRAGATQQDNGILDVYYDRVRFGLMTFDNDIRTGVSAYNGMFSYASNRVYRPNMCLVDTNVNLGAKRASADGNVADVVPGGLISVGSPSADVASLQLINRQVQETVTGRMSGPGPVTEMPGVRPFGTTPIAAFLEDALHYWRTNQDVTDGSAGGLGDPYFNCRTRANILITDGAPTDFRPSCVGGQCPYDPPSQTAMTMAMVGAGLPNVRTYVLAFNGSDPEAVNTLEPIAIAGNTTRVYYANDRPTFAAALSSIIDTITSQTSTRTPPVFGEAGSTSPAGTSQYQFNASFNVVPGQPWAGSLSRTRTVCQAPAGGGAPVPTQVDPDQTAGDDFAYNLRRSTRDSRGWGSRYLWTYVPTGAVTAAAMRRNIPNGLTAGLGAPVELSSGMNASLFNYSTGGEVTTLLAWLRGDIGTNRENRPLGDIFRSTPSYVSAPRVNLPDQTFLAFRQRTLPIAGRRRSAITVGTREPMIYVGSNDGVLHAFNADTGEEAWGFVPPYLVPNLRNGYPSTRTQGVDGTPVVKEVYYERSNASLTDDTNWHTVLVVGLRAGGGAYVGMDVTDPYNPQFLWQFTDLDLQVSSGTPAIGTVYYAPNGGNPVERAVAFLPGGAGELAASCTPTAAARLARPNTLMTGWSSGRGARRPYVRCWNGNQGRFFYVVDLKTGALIRKIGALPTSIPYDPSTPAMALATSPAPTHSPIVGAPALYNGFAGVVTTRAYVGDADGSLWRVDMSSTNPANWWMGDAFDLFWDRGYNSGQPIIERPVTSIDERGRTIIAFGSGDTDLLEGADENRVESIVETTQTDAAGTAVGITIEENWGIRPGTQTVDRDFLAGERLTGALTLFNNVLYFGTFAPRVGTDPCEMGAARLWGVDLTRNDPVGTTYPAGRLDRDGDPMTTADVVRVTRDLNNNGSEVDDANSLLFGVAVARRPNCNVSATVTDPVTGQPRTFVSSTTGGEYRLVLQIAQTGMAGGTTTATFTRSLPAPIVPSRIDSVATVFE